MNEVYIPSGELCGNPLLLGRHCRFNAIAVDRLFCTLYEVNTPAIMRCSQCLADFPHGAVVELKAKESK